MQCCSKEFMDLVRNDGYFSIQRPKDTKLMMVHVKNVPESPLVEKINGLIIDETSGHIVCANHPFTHESSIEDEVVVSEQGNLYHWYLAFDGTMLRFYYHDDRWKIASNKKIDARLTFWGKHRVSFAEMAEELYLTGKTDLPDQMDKSKTYLTLLRHPDAYLTLRASNNEPFLFFVGTVDNNEAMACTYNDKYAFTGNAQDRLHFLLGSDGPSVFRGLIAVHRDNGKRYKIDTKEFTHISLLKGHDQDPRVRYLKLYAEEDGEVLQRELAMYFRMMFDHRELDDMVKMIHKTYLHMFVFRDKIDSSIFLPFVVHEVPNFFLFLLNKLHQEFRKTHTKRTLVHVKQLLAVHAEPFVKMMDSWIHKVDNALPLRYRSFEDLVTVNRTS